MPIPQLSYRNMSGRNTETSKKKYFVAKAGNGGKRPENKKFSNLLKNKRFWKYVGIISGILLLAGIIGVFWISRQLPDPNHLLDRQIAQSTKIYDRSGETILYEIHGDQKRTLVSLNDIPNEVKWATVAIEDKDFYKHGGFSLWAIARTAVTNIFTGKKAGGSTLTQQFIKNAVLTNEKTYTRKIKELLLAYKLEQKFSKDEILQMYLNEIPYGSTAYGIEAASQRYFGKSSKDINLAEAAVLAALPQAPSYYSPYGSHKDALINRQQYVLNQMAEQGYISQDQAEEAKKVTIEFSKPAENIMAPHFVMYIKEALSEKYGEKTVEQGGLKIYTTLDLSKQKIAEETIENYGEKNATKYDASNAALVSIDPKTGQILAMVGSRDYFNDEIDGQVNIVTSDRQPGSSIKPLVYATAFTKGYNPNTILYDVVTNFSTDESNPYEPKNYDLSERGPVSMRKALAGSLNVPAVKTIYLAGINNVQNLAEDLGYTTLSDTNRFGLALVLGGGEVKLLEHANAFSAFARDGNIHPVTGVLKVEDKDGKILEEYQGQEKKALDTLVAREVTDILSDNNARSYIFGSQNWLTLGSRPVAAKTGTTNDWRDAWTIGYTPSIVTGVWVGNNNNEPMKRGADGGIVAAPIWHDYMKAVLGDTPVEEFKKPEIPKTGKAVLDGPSASEEIVKIDRASGLLATENTPASFIEEKTFRQDHSILYYIDRNDPLGDPPQNPAQDPQFILWESRIKQWATKNGFASTTPPTEHDNLHISENKPLLNIISPTGNQEITSSAISIEVETSAPRGVSKVEYYIDGNLLSEQTSSPFNASIRIGYMDNGFHSLEVKACDDIDNCSEQTMDFNLSLSSSQQDNEYGLTWAEPSNGIALTNLDFPLSLKLILSNFAMIGKISIYYVNENGKTEDIANLEQINSWDINYVWNTPPPSGTYKLYAEAIGRDNKIKKAGPIYVTVNNIQE